MKKFISIIFILLIFSIISYADFETGNSLLKALSYDNIKKPKLSDIAEIVDYWKSWGYLIGVYDSYSNWFYETPEGVTAGQILDIAKKYLEDHPESRHEPATDLLIKAFSEAFPIKKEKDKKGGMNGYPR